MYQLWELKLLYVAKFGTFDVLHKIIDMSCGGFVMFAGVQLQPYDILSNNENGIFFGLVSCILLFHLYIICLWIEVYLTAYLKKDPLEKIESEKKKKHHHHNHNSNKKKSMKKKKNNIKRNYKY